MIIWSELTHNEAEFDALYDGLSEHHCQNDRMFSEEERQ